MVTLWSTAEFTRKTQCIKDSLREDDFYSDTILTRVVTKTGTSGLYNRNLTFTYTDTIVSGVAVYRPDYVSYEEEVQTIDSDVQFTCKVNNKSSILNADELWLDYTLSGSVVTTGKMYKVTSDKSSLFKLDHIFNLAIAGKQSAT